MPSVHGLRAGDLVARALARRTTVSMGRFLRGHHEGQDDVSIAEGVFSDVHGPLALFDLVLIARLPTIRSLLLRVIKGFWLVCPESTGVMRPLLLCALRVTCRLGGVVRLRDEGCLGRGFFLENSRQRGK